MKKTLGENKKTSTVGLEPPVSCFTGYGCLHLRLLDTIVGERWILLACKNKLGDPQRHSFHFEQDPFQSVLTRPSYQRAKKCRQTAFQLYIYSLLAGVPALSCRCMHALTYLDCYVSLVYLVCCTYT